MRQELCVLENPKWWLAYLLFFGIHSSHWLVKEGLDWPRQRRLKGMRHVVS